MTTARSSRKPTRSIWTKTRRKPARPAAFEMSAPFDQTGQAHKRIVISIDAMGGDRGPTAVVAGMAESAAKNPDLHFIVHGPKDELDRLIARAS
jgi:hypothetical protein